MLPYGNNTRSIEREFSPTWCSRCKKTVDEATIAATRLDKARRDIFFVSREYEEGIAAITLMRSPFVSAIC